MYIFFVHIGPQKFQDFRMKFKSCCLWMLQSLTQQLILENYSKYFRQVESSDITRLLPFTAAKPCGSLHMQHSFPSQDVNLGVLCWLFLLLSMSHINSSFLFLEVTMKQHYICTDGNVIHGYFQTIVCKCS